jgi:sulfide dehydrogenase cytochrome subunit
MLLALTAPAVAQERGTLLAGACQGCHGAAGAGSDGIPAIAGTHGRAEFTEILRAFRDGRREATVMGRIARGYGEAEIAALAAHYAKRD